MCFLLITPVNLLVTFSPFSQLVFMFQKSYLACNPRETGRFHFLTYIFCIWIWIFCHLSFQRSCNFDCNFIFAILYIRAQFIAIAWNNLNPQTFSVQKYLYTFVYTLQSEKRSDNSRSIARRRTGIFRICTL